VEKENQRVDNFSVHFFPEVDFLFPQRLWNRKPLCRRALRGVSTKNPSTGAVSKKYLILFCFYIKFLRKKRGQRYDEVFL
jgi:hypothetical protein